MGLAIGMACCLLILMFVRDELSYDAGLAVGLAWRATIVLYVTNELTYDSFHPDSERLDRIADHRIN